LRHQCGDITPLLHLPYIVVNIAPQQTGGAREDGILQRLSKGLLLRVEVTGT
jgi:hypothetical protein